jgi:hypothetical protein
MIKVELELDDLYENVLGLENNTLIAEKNSLLLQLIEAWIKQRDVRIANGPHLKEDTIDCQFWDTASAGKYARRWILPYRYKNKYAFLIEEKAVAKSLDWVNENLEPIDFAIYPISRHIHVLVIHAEEKAVHYRMCLDDDMSALQP